MKKRHATKGSDDTRIKNRKRTSRLKEGHEDTRQRKRRKGAKRGRFSEDRMRSLSLFKKMGALRFCHLYVDGKLREFDLHSEFRLTSTSVRRRFYVEAEQFVFFRHLLAIARRKLAAAEDKLDSVRAWQELGYRVEAEEAGEARDPYWFKVRVDTDSKVAKAKKKARVWENQVDLLLGIVSGLEHLKSMTISAGAEDRNNNKYLREEG